MPVAMVADDDDDDDDDDAAAACEAVEGAVAAPGTSTASAGGSASISCRPAGLSRAAVTRSSFAFWLSYLRRVYTCTMLMTSRSVSVA